MGTLDLGFDRLVNAWYTALRRDAAASGRPVAANDSRPPVEGWSWGPGHVAMHGATRDALPPPAATHVLIVTPPASTASHAAADTAAALQSRIAADESFRTTAASAAGALDVERQLRLHAPRLLLIDAELAQTIGVDALRALRRGYPDCDWLLLWREPSLRDFELAVACQARGCIEWQSSPEQLLHALAVVAAGDLWFPRRVLHSLYFSLIAAARGNVPGGPASNCATCLGGPALTERESEALLLMREGLTNQQIADRVGVSINTVKKHLGHAFAKRGLHSRRQLLG